MKTPDPHPEASGGLDDLNLVGSPPPSPCGEEPEPTTQSSSSQPCQPLLLPPPRSHHLWRAFIHLTKGSILYCLSALCIIYGIVRIVGPILARSDVLNQTLPCLGVLNLYELALLGAILLLVLWKNVTDDAVFLVVLIALFLIASGITLDTVANNSPPAAAAVGLASVLIAAENYW